MLKGMKDVMIVMKILLTALLMERGGGGRWIRAHRKMRCSRVVEGRVNTSPWFNYQIRKSVCSIAISKYHSSFISWSASDHEGMHEL
jgi:hypothetical protein